MNIRTLFKTEEELAKRFGERFMRMFHGLLERYSRKGKPVQSYALKAAALAFVFYGAAEDGNAELMRNFDSMLHGSYSEQLCLEDHAVCLEDDLNATLVWDIAALMLEASGVQFPQEAFDMVGKHVWMAYEQEVTTDGPSESVQKKVVAVEAKNLNADIPSIPIETMEWMLSDAAKAGDVQRVEYLGTTFTSNLMQRYFSNVFQMIQDAKITARQNALAAQQGAEGIAALHSISDAIKGSSQSMEKLAARTGMNDNNGIVAGGDVDAKFTVSNEQWKMLTDLLAGKLNPFLPNK